MRALQQSSHVSSPARQFYGNIKLRTIIRSLAALRYAHSRHVPLTTVAAAAVSQDSQTHADQEPSVSYSRQHHSADTFPELQLQLPEPTNVLVKSAEFVKSSRLVSECPPPKHPEFAVIGRSNVGKSSLINLLTGRNKLAMVSKDPGKTRCINHFLINNSWYLVDLPGFGYARTGKDNRKEFEWFTKNYFLQRPTLTMVFLLVDSSISPRLSDLEYAVWLASKNVPFSIVFTKVDKRKKGQPKHTSNIISFKRALIDRHGFSAIPPSVVTSASAGLGKHELLGLIASLRVLFEKQSRAEKVRDKA